MNEINRTITAYDSVAGMGDTWPRSATLIAALEELERGGIDAAVDAVGRWMSTRALDDDTAREIAIFDMYRARKLRENGDLEGAAAALRGIGLKTAPLGQLLHEAVLQWQETGDNGFLAEYLVAGLFDNRFVEVERLLARSLDRRAFAAIIEGLPPGGISPVLARLKPPAVAEICGSPAWSTLSLLYERESVQGLKPNIVKQLVGALNHAIAEKRPADDLVRLLALIGGVYNPVAHDIAMPDFLGNAIVATGQYLAGHAPDLPGEAPLVYLALGEAIAESSDAGESLAATRALWLIFTHPAAVSPSTFPSAIWDLLSQLIEVTGPHQAEARLLRGLLQGKPAQDGVDVPRIQLAARALKAADLAIAANDAKMARGHLASAKKNGASPLPIAVRSAALATLTRKAGEFLAEIKAAGFEDQLGLVLRAILVQYGLKPASSLAKLLPAEAVERRSFWKTSPFAEARDGEALLDILLTKLAAQENPPLEAAIGALKHQIANQPSAVRARLLEPTLRLLAKCAEAEPVLTCKAAVPLLAKMFLDLAAPDGTSAAGHRDLLKRWSRTRSLVPSMALRCGLARAFIESDGVDASAKAAIADTLLPDLLAAANAGTGLDGDEGDIAAIALAATDRKEALKLAAGRAATGNAAAYTKFLEKEIDSSLKSFDLKRANALLAFIEPIEPASRKSSTRRLVIDMLGATDKRRQALSQIPSDGLLAFLDQVSRTLGSAIALRLVDLLPVSRLAKVTEWRRVAELENAFGDAHEVIDRIVNRLSQAETVDLEAISIASRLAFTASDSTWRLNFLGKLLKLTDRQARRLRRGESTSPRDVANGIVAQYYLAVCGHAPNLDECWSVLAKLRPDQALLGYYRRGVLSCITSASSVDPALAEHARRVIELEKDIQVAETALQPVAEDVFLLAAASDTAPLKEKLAALAAWQTSGKDSKLATAAAKFCLGQSTDKTVRGLALDILWHAKTDIATVLAAVWNIHPARFFEVVNWLAAKNLLATVAIQAAEQLPETARPQFFETLPITVLGRRSQWSNAALILAAKRNFEGAYALVVFLAEKSLPHSPDASAALEMAAKALLPNLSNAQNYLLATKLVSFLAKLPAGIRSPTLVKAIRPFSGARDLEAVATQSFNSGDRRTALAAIDALSTTDRLNHERLAKFVDMLIEFGEADKAVRLVQAFHERQPHLRNQLHLMRIALVEGDEVQIKASANAIIKAKGALIPRRFDAPISRLASVHLPDPLKRVITRTFGVSKAKRRLENAAVVLRAKTVLGDVEGARRLAARMSGQGLLGSAIDEIGFLVHHTDFAAAETKLAELIGNALRRQRLLARIRQPLRLRSIDRAVEHAYLLQRFLMNQGRDVSFLAKLEELVLKALRSPWRGKLSSVAEGRLFTIGLATLKIRLHSTEPELPVMRQLADELVHLTKSRTDRQIRLSQHLLQGWQADGGHHVDQAIAAVTSEMRTVLARASAGKKKVDAEFARRHFEEQRAQGFAALDRKQATALARLVNTGLNLSNQQSAYEVFDDLLVTARALLAHAAAKKWFAVPILQAMARKVRDIAPDVPQALEFLQAADDGVTSDMRYLCLMAATMVSTGSSNDALRYVNRGLAVFPNSAPLLQLAVQIHGNLGNAQLARESAMRLAALIKAQAVFELGRPSRIRDSLEIDNTLAQFKFRADTSKVMATVLPPRRAAPKGVVFASFYKCMASASITTMPFLELKKRGYDIVYLNSGTIDAEPTGHEMLDRFRGILQVDGSVIAGLDVPTSSLIADWKMDWDNRRIEADDINFYQPIFERLTQQSRTYSINVQDAQVGRQIKGMIRLLDRALHVAKMIKTEVCSLGIPVRFASSNWQYPPYAAFRIVCDAWKHECDIGFVAVSPGYESYYANLGKLYATTAAAVNMTVNHESRAPFLPIRSKFDAWFAANRSNSPALDTEVKKWIATDRAGVGHELPPEAQAVMDRVRRFRAGGGKVIGVFGKIVYDLAVPYAGGPAHTDMKDFLNHTVASAARSDALVLIKPHPHELRYEIARNPREYFTDMIEVKIPDNVVLLGHRWFNVRDMIEMIDLGVLWNGTTGVELGASGIPVVMCDDWGPRDYPVGHFAPKDRQHYEQIIRDPSLVKMADDYPEKCAALLKYLSTDAVMRPYPFVKRGLVNVDVGPPVWDFAEVDRYLKEGDKYVSALADDFKFEKERDA